MDDILESPGFNFLHRVSARRPRDKRIVSTTKSTLNWFPVRRLIVRLCLFCVHRFVIDQTNLFSILFRLHTILFDRLRLVLIASSSNTDSLCRCNGRQCYMSSSSFLPTGIFYRRWWSEPVCCNMFVPKGSNDTGVRTYGCQGKERRV